MNKKILILISGLLLFLAHPCKAQDLQQVPVDDSRKTEILQAVTSQYTPWSKMSMSGKLSSPMLPVSASVKIYMEKGELLLISVSAPLIGEAARIEIDKDQALVVNKLNNSYTTAEMMLVEQICPGGLEVLQNLLLGRATIIGSGELTVKDADKLQIYQNTEDMGWVLIPDSDMEDPDYVYGYLFNGDTWLMQRCIVAAQNESATVEGTYTWGKKDMSIAFQALMGSQSLGATLKLNSPDATPKQMSRIELGGKYRKTDLRGILRM